MSNDIMFYYDYWQLFQLYYVFRVHYVEYLSGLIFRNNVEPVSILDIGEMKQVFSRANHFLPKQRAGEYEFQFKRRLADVR